MIADTLRNRIITRTFIKLVAAVAPLSLTFALYTLLTRPIQNLGSLHGLLYVWCVAESIFWGLWLGKYKARRVVFERVIPSREERRKLREDCLQIIDFSPDGATEFIEGWFKTGKQIAKIGEIHKDNIADW